MSRWEARLAEAFAATEARAAALEPHPRREALLRSLAAIARALSAGPRAHASTISAALIAAMQEAAMRVADGHDALALLAPLANLANAWRDHPERPTSLPDQGLPAVAPLRASSARPRLHAPARARFDPAAARDAGPVARADRAEEEPIDQDDDQDDQTPARAPRGAPDGADAVWAPGEPPPVRIAEKGGEPMTVAAFHADVVRLAAETVATLARDRDWGPLGRRADVESRLLARADAVACVGGDVIAHLLAWWREAIEMQGPWCTWSAVFLLAVLQGSDALDAVLHGLERLPPDAAYHAVLAAEALAVSPHPDAVNLAHLLSMSPHPAARAAGIGALSRCGQLAPDALADHLIDPNLPVLVAALDAAPRLDADGAAAIAPLLRRWIASPQAPVAWSAARALTRMGHLDPLTELRCDGRITAALAGLDQLELLVLCGDASDLPRVRRLVARLPISPALLSALARLGHPGLWAFLAHHLADPEHADSAAAALVTLCGALVPEDEEASAPAWRRAIQDKGFDPTLRYRRGEPYGPGVIARECRSGELPRPEIERRLDELAVRARVGVGAHVELGRFAPDLEPALSEVLAAADRADAGFPRGRF